jgi:hypothetical protein
VPLLRLTTDRGANAVHEHEHDLSPEERAKVHAQVEFFISVIERRYNMTANDVAEAVRWVGKARDRNARYAQAGAVSLIGMIATAGALSLWEGIKTWIRK